MRKFVDNHPLAVAIVLVVTTASITFAVVNYFFEQHITSLNSKHTGKVANLEQDYKTRILDYETRISELNNRLVSINRGVSSRTNNDSETSYFNVRKILVSREAVSQLSPEYESFQSSRFYVKPSSDKRWTHSQMSEAEFFQLVYSRKFFENFPEKLKRFLQNATVELWRSNDQLRMSFSTDNMPGFDQLELTLFPYVSAQTISRKDISTPDKNWRTVLGNEIGKVVPSDDITAYFLYLELLSGQMFSQLIKDASFETLAIEKKGNVLYMKYQVNLRGSGKLSGEKETIVVVQEKIIFTTAEDLIVIETHVPTSSGVDEDFSWITQWLTNLRIPVQF